MKKIFFITKDQRILDAKSDTYKRHKQYFCNNKDVIFLILLNKIDEKKIDKDLLKDLNISFLISGYSLFIKKLIFEKSIHKIVLQDFNFELLLILLFKKFKKYKILTQIHSEVFSLNWILLKFKNLIKFFYICFSILFIDEVRVVNNKTKKILIKFFKKKKIYNIPVPILYNFSNTNSKINFYNLILVTEFVKIKNYKGIEILIKKISKFNLQIKEINIFGDGKYFDNFKKKIDIYSYPFKINFHGYKKLEFIENYYKNSFFLINLSRSESYSRVIVEALLCELPVLSFKSSGPNELLDNNFLFNFGDYSSMIDKLHFYQNNKSLYKEIKNELKLFKINYSKDILINKWSNLIFK